MLKSLDASPAISSEFDEMQKHAVDPATMLVNLDLMCNLDVENEARLVPHPTLLIHSRGNLAVDVTEGARLATMMPNAEFVSVDSCNIIFALELLGSEQAIQVIEKFLDKYSDNSKPGCSNKSTTINIKIRATQKPFENIWPTPWFS